MAQPNTQQTSAQPPRSPSTEPGAFEADAQLYLHPQTLARLETMELRAKMIVEGVMSGVHRSPYKGFSIEFAQHRPYVAGDDLKHLDWKVYGRSDKLYLKQYEQETNLDLVLLVDCSGSMAFGSRSFEDASGSGRTTSPDGRLHWSKYDHATAAAAAFAYLALHNGDRVGLGIFADHLIDTGRRNAAQGQWRRIVGALSTQPVEKPSDFARVIDEALAKLTNRCLMCIISDFFEDPEKIRTALARIRHKRHDVIVCRIVDRQEQNFEFGSSAGAGGMPFEGLEGEGRLRVDPRAIKSAYLKAFNDHLEQVEKITRSFGFDYLQMNTHDWLGPPLAAFVARRNAIIKRSKSG